MMPGLILRTSSSSMPSLRRALGRKFVRNTSLERISSCSTPRASGCSSARPMPRWASPVSACSTLITSAPQSARTAPAAGTKVNCATSRTRTPSIGRITTVLLCPGSVSIDGEGISRWSDAGRTDMDDVHHQLARLGEDVVQNVRDGRRCEELGSAHSRQVAVGLPDRTGPLDVAGSEVFMDSVIAACAQDDEGYPNRVAPEFLVHRLGETVEPTLGGGVESHHRQVVEGDLGRDVHDVAAARRA